MEICLKILVNDATTRGCISTMCLLSTWTLLSNWEEHLDVKVKTHITDGATRCHITNLGQKINILERFIPQRAEQTCVFHCWLTLKGSASTCVSHSHLRSSNTYEQEGSTWLSSKAFRQKNRVDHDFAFRSQWVSSSLIYLLKLVCKDRPQCNLLFLFFYTQALFSFNAITSEANHLCH